MANNPLHTLLESLAPAPLCATAALYRADTDTIEYANVNTQIESVFSAASISKTMVGVAIMQCHANHQLNIDDDVTSHLPPTLPPFRNPNFPSTIITIRMLLQHKASLVDSEYALRDPPYRVAGTTPHPMSLSDYVEDLIKTRHIVWSGRSPAGSFVYYSNAGFTVLGCVIEHTHQRPFAEVIREYIFSPLQMNHSTFHLKDAHPNDNVIRPTLDNGKQEYYQVAEFPAAQLRSNAHDLIHYLKSFIHTHRSEHPLLPLSAIELMMPSDMSNGLGWWGKNFIYHSGGGCWEHGGLMEGIRSYAFVWDAGAFVVFVNGNVNIDGLASKFVEGVRKSQKKQ